MKRIIFPIASALIVSTIFVQAQNLLNNNWQFKTGDSLEWKNTAYNASNWKSISPGAIWENQGYQGYDGIAWYRQTLTIPSNLRKEIEKEGGITIHLGTIDDADQTFFNGTLIGETGKFTPHFQSAYDIERRYFIPLKAIRWDQPNVLAIRVYDDAGGGGLTSMNVSGVIGDLGSAIKMEATFPTVNRIFTDNKKMWVKVNVRNHSTIALNGKFDFVLTNAFYDTLKTESVKMSVAAQKDGLVTYSLPALKPGFYSLIVRINSKRFMQADKFNFGVEPDKIEVHTDRAPDFDAFWARAKRELAAVDPQFKLTLQDSLSNDKRSVYLVEMRSLDNVLIRGWYIRPKAEGKYPAILHVQGYSSVAVPVRKYLGDDMAALILNIRGHGNSRDEINPGFPGFLMYNLKDRERYIYRGAYMDCIRAVDFLCSRAEVDSRYIVVEGGSQGGALSIATAALDNKRICLCMPSVPFLSDFRDYFRVANWPANEFVDFVKKNPAFGWEKLYENLSYFDMKNLAPWIECPVFMAVGLKDVVCPPYINFAAYNQIHTAKTYIAFPEAGHSLPIECMTQKFEWMKKQLSILQKGN